MNLKKVSDENYFKKKYLPSLTFGRCLHFKDKEPNVIAFLIFNSQFLIEILRGASKTLTKQKSRTQ